MKVERGSIEERGTGTKEDFSSLNDQGHPFKSHSASKGLGIIGMHKAFSDLPIYSGMFQEDVDGLIATFDTLEEMCDLSDEDKRKAILQL